MNTELIEEWRPVVGYEGIYEISNMGSARSLDRVVKGGKGRSRFNKGRMLRPSMVGIGYCSFQASVDGVKERIMIHQEVAKTFVPNPSAKTMVNHINGIKTDNRAKNLEWCTARENLIHAIQTGLRPPHSEETKRKMSIAHVKPVLQYLISGEFVNEYPSVTIAAKEIGIAKGCISACANGKTKTSMGFKWQFKKTA